MRRMILAGLIVASAASGALVQIFALPPVKVIGWLPATRGLYQMLGVPVSDRGLTIVKVWTVASGPGNAVLEIRGRVVNPLSQSITVPDIVVRLHDTNGRTASSIRARIDTRTIGPGNATLFHARMPAPNGEGYKVVARFSEQQ
ncbi:MAG: hypothetical protein AB7E70_01195 [Hyphomicrobiaceae bacterium]